jgi:lipid-A-disaccharide synthase
LREFVDRMLVIFPFEVAYYEKAGIPVEFVGHPLVDLAVASQPRETFLDSVGLRDDRPVLACLPGSRSNEVRTLLPALVKAATIVASTVSGLQLLVARAAGLSDDLFAPLTRARDAGLPVAIVEHATDDVLAAADAVVTASGTATVQAALHGKPMVIVYRLSGVTYAMARSFVRLRTYGMVNLVAGRKIVPEVIQGDFSAENVAREVLPLFTDPARVARMREDLAEVRARLGAPGASKRAAQSVATYLT